MPLAGCGRSRHSVSPLRPEPRRSWRLARRAGEVATRMPRATRPSTVCRPSCDLLGTWDDPPGAFDEAVPQLRSAGQFGAAVRGQCEVLAARPAVTGAPGRFDEVLEFQPCQQRVER